MMGPQNTRDQQFQAALWAVKRIARKPPSVPHSSKGFTPDGQTCDCPQCIANDAIERIEQLEREALVK